jgi:hypoxanthine phosphoribosyltransferase
MQKLAYSLLAASSLCFGAKAPDVLIPPEMIDQKLSEIAVDLNTAYKEEGVTILMVMKGAICVTADLMRHLTVDTTLECISASSYGKKGTVRGELTVTGLDKLDLEGKNVLIVDDIFDTGHTMSALIEQVATKGPKTLKSLVLLTKDVPRQIPYRPDYSLFTIDNHFVIGYGLDYNENYRHLPGIYYFPNGI